MYLPASGSTAKRSKKSGTCPFWPRDRTSSASYRFHKARNCAVVTIDGKNHSLGPYHSPEIFEKYNRLIAGRQAGSRVLDPVAPPSTASRLSINELILRYSELATGLTFPTNRGRSGEVV